MSVDLHPFSAAERERFRNLLRLAAESPFANERDNARAAAERMAARHCMTLEEAAMERPPQPVPKIRVPEWSNTLREFAGVIHLMDNFIKADKERREEALREARERGLDAEALRKQRDRENRRPPRNKDSRRNEYSHARILLSETTLPLSDIAGITGLDIYQVVGLKLKMRAAA